MNSKRKKTKEEKLIERQNIFRGIKQTDAKNVCIKTEEKHWEYDGKWKKKEKKNGSQAAVH